MIVLLVCLLSAAKHRSLKLILSRILSLIIQRRLFGLSDGTYQSAGTLRGNLLKLNPTKCAEYSAHKYPQSPVSEW